MTKVGPRQQCPLVAGDPDSHPIPQLPPVPMEYSSLVSRPDQDLALTPVKVGTEAGILKRGRGGKQAQRQVRFDVSPRSKVMAFNPTGVSGEEAVVITVTGEPSCNPPELETSHRTVKGKDLKGKNNPKKRRDPKPKARELSAGGQSGVPAEGQSGVLTEGQSGVPAEGQSGMLCEGAELNTTLALRVELEELAEAVFDPRKAVQQQLKKSTHTKYNIAIRATEGVNIPRSQHLYQALVSVSVSEDQLISQALHDRLTLVQPKHSHRNQESPAEGPNLLAFYSPGELLRESPLLLGDEVQQFQPRPVPRPAHATFDLYHRHRQWEA